VSGILWSAGHFLRTLKGVGRIYQQTFIDTYSKDTYSKVAFAKLYDRKTPIAAADLLNESNDCQIRS
jgi:hypothetical protein